MLKLHAGHRIAVSLLAVAFALGLAASASADTIYLKNGRVIRSSEVRVEGDQVIFVQYAGEVSIPLALVDRIVEDARTEPEATPVPVAATTADPGTGPDDPPEAEDVPPEQTREYWQDRVRAIETERADIEMRIRDLRLTEEAFLFSSLSTADTRRKIDEEEANYARLDEEMEALRLEARRLQVPSGWLRVKSEGGQG